MAKQPTLTDVGSGFLSAAAINANNDSIEDAFDNTLSRDGSTPNQMEADLDLNGNDLINVGNITLEDPGSTIDDALVRGILETYLINTKVDVETTTISSSIDAIRTSGYATVGDGGHGLYKKAASEPAHEGKVQSADDEWWELVPDNRADIRQFGAVADGATDAYTAIVNALAAFDHVVIRGGTYACSDGVEIDADQSIKIESGSKVIRLAAHSSTDPIFWLKGNRAGLHGEDLSSFLETEKACPFGIVRLGHENLTTSHTNCSFMNVHNLLIRGSTTGGQTSGTPDQAIAIYNPQLGGFASYFHHIHNVIVDSVNTGIGLHGFANANKIHDVEVYRCGNSAGDAYRKAIHLNGAQENEIRGIFHHSSSDSYSVWVEELDNSGNGGTTHTPAYNKVVWISEQGGASARALIVDSIGANNSFSIGSNVALAPTITPADFGKNNELWVNGVLWTPLRSGHQATLTARLTKRDLTTNAATVNFMLGNADPGGSYRHGYVKITASADDSATQVSDTAWFLYQASSINEAYPEFINLKDSGGDTGSFTVSLTTGDLEIATVFDNLVVSVEYTSSAGTVSIY